MTADDETRPRIVINIDGSGLSGKALVKDIAWGMKTGVLPQRPGKSSRLRRLMRRMSVRWRGIMGR